MLPFGGQGSNQAIEDGGVLGSVFANISDAVDVPARLKLFSDLRIRRASRVQILSSVRANNEHLIQDQLQKYMEPGVPGELILCSIKREVLIYANRCTDGSP